MHIRKPQPRNVVKFVVDCAGYGVATTGTTLAIEAVVDPETESAEWTCEVAGTCIGSMVWYGTRQHAFNLIDNLADRRMVRKEMKRAAKAAKKSQKES